MKTEDYIKLVEKIKEMLTNTGYMLSMLLGALKADLLKENTESTDLEIKFTEKEISQMPKIIKKEFRAEGCTARITTKKSGKTGTCYVIRYRRNGYNIAVSSTNLQTAKEKFLQALHNAETVKQLPCVPTGFTNFANYYLNNFQKEKVQESTFRNYLHRIKNWLEPAFGNLEIKDITPMQCKDILKKAQKDGKNKTAQELYGLMSIIFKGAIAHGIITRSPLSIIKRINYERKHGIPLTPEEEKKLLQAFEGKEKQTIAIMLYCGLRPNEVSTARINGNFVEAKNSKQKNGKTVIKKIPITPMLKPYLQNFTGAKSVVTQTLNKWIKKVLPNHTAKDCRTTFATRCQECSVPTDVVKIWMGHSLGTVLGNNYTIFSEEYQIKQANKVKY